MIIRNSNERIRGEGQSKVIVPLSVTEQAVPSPNNLPTVKLDINSIDENVVSANELGGLIKQHCIMFSIEGGNQYYVMTDEWEERVPIHPSSGSNPPDSDDFQLRMIRVGQTVSS